MNAEIIAIGSELTCGARLDTNSRWLSEQLEGLGWTTTRHTTVADDRAAMVALFQEAVQRSRVVLVTGGLGPTRDDITRETLAEAVEQPLVEDADSLEHITSLFVKRGREMPARNHVQALRPEQAESLFNAQGTAPGILLNLSSPESTVAVMPGVPAEMFRMFREQVVPRLPGSSVVVKRSQLRTFGFGESDAEQRLGDLTDRGRNPEVGITASNAVISLSITARADSEADCDAMIAQASQEIRNCLGDAVFTEGQDDLPVVVGTLIASKKVRIALLEGTTTGGLLAHWLTADDSVAGCLTECKVAPGPVDFTDAATSLIEDGTCDFVLVSDASTMTDQDKMPHKKGRVAMFGRGVSTWSDVQMSGNLVIFRERAARHALNLLRLHLLKAST